MKVLFLCHGNINRSIAGEVISRKIKPEWEVKSAALKDTKGGEIIAKKMRSALTEMGYEFGEERSTPINEELMRWADVVFYMDNKNWEKIEDKFDKSLQGKCVKISTLIGADKIPDPHFQKGTEHHKEVIRMLEIAITKYD